MAIINGPVADPTIVRELTNHLLEAYEEFIRKFDGGLTYAEGMMGAHNFHVQVIEALVEETGHPVWRNAAKTTFARRMDHPGEQDTKMGGNDKNER